MSMVFDHMSFYYNKGQKDEVQALDSITMTIEKHEYVGLIGHTEIGRAHV